MKVFRTKVFPRFENVYLTPLPDGVRLEIGSLHIPISEKDALKLCDGIIDLIESEGLAQ